MAASKKNPLSAFHPAIRKWFLSNFDGPTLPQKRGWPAIHSGRDTLISAPTGSGKTLAAFLATIDSLFRQGLEDDLPNQCQVVYVSPLKALSNDVQKNLAQPLEEIRQVADGMGVWKSRRYGSLCGRVTPPPPSGRL
jgi:ATP-dependent Lhr-like helicase